MDLSGDTVVIRLVLVVVCLVLSAFFSSSETALTTVNLIRIRNLADNGDKAAARVLKARRDQSKMLGAILIGNNVVNLSASSMLTVLVTDVFGSQAVGAATGVLTLLVLLFGEITPKIHSYSGGRKKRPSLCESNLLSHDHTDTGYFCCKPALRRGSASFGRGSQQADRQYYGR